MSSYFAALDAFSEPSSRVASERFFANFWLPEQDLKQTWCPLLRRTFGSWCELVQNRGLRVVDQSVTAIESIGGLLLTEGEFGELRGLMATVGDESFAIIEDYDESNPPHTDGPALRFVFPVDVSWRQLTSGGYISTELFGMPHKNYFVLGNRGQWVKYVANDWDSPMDITIVSRRFEREFRAAYGRIS